MDNTIVGGCYLAPDGKTYLDANGEKVSDEKVAEFKELQSANAERVAAIEEQLRLTNLTPAQALAQILKPSAPAVVEPKAQPVVTDAWSDNQEPATQPVRVHGGTAQSEPKAKK